MKIASQAGIVAACVLGCLAVALIWAPISTTMSERHAHIFVDSDAGFEQARQEEARIQKLLDSDAVRIAAVAELGVETEFTSFNSSGGDGVVTVPPVTEIPQVLSSKFPTLGVL